MDGRLRRLVGLSAVLTGLLMVLGVYTAASGAGLTCAGRWPFCDGVWGLFPANWSSFIEWFHRLVAMITGVTILGTAIRAWRVGADRRVRLALAASTILLPSQIALGALTVTTYEWAILLAHFGTASMIFTGVALAAAWAYGTAGVDIARVRTVLTAAAGLLPVLLLLAPHTFVAFGPTVQAAYYLAGLAAYAALLTAAVWSAPAGTARGGPGRVTSLAVAAALLVVSLLVAGRLVYGGTLQYVSLGGGVAALGLVALARHFVGGADRSVDARRAPTDD
jgi:cytochrome c oxidase assembly protein subunit 15